MAGMEAPGVTFLFAQFLNLSHADPQAGVQGSTRGLVVFLVTDLYPVTAFLLWHGRTASRLILTHRGPVPPLLRIGPEPEHTLFFTL